MIFGTYATCEGQLDAYCTAEINVHASSKTVAFINWKRFFEMYPRSLTSIDSEIQATYLMHKPKHKTPEFRIGVNSSKRLLIAAITIRLDRW